MADEIRVEIDKSGGEGKINRIISGLPEATSRLLDTIGAEFRIAMSSEAPVRTGDLQGSHVVESTEPLSRLIYPTAPHARFVVEGTKPHEIIAKGWMGAQYLGVRRYGRTGLGQGMVSTPGGGRSVYTGRMMLFWPGADHPVMRVQHPGTAPNDYISRARDSVDVQSLVDAYLNELANL
jgi:hypothetical protein